MINKKFCPNCGSEDIELIAGGISGNFMCGDCGFSGSFFPEKEILDEEVKSERKKTNKNENKKKRNKKI